jgi:hypothetical protein
MTTRKALPGQTSFFGGGVPLPTAPPRLPPPPMHRPPPAPPWPAPRTTMHDRDLEAEDSARGRVATLLRKQAGQWVRGSLLASAGVGGSEGLRRLRELRNRFGWRIEQRRVPGSTEREYRFVP